MCGGFFANQRGPHASDVVLENLSTAIGPLFAIFLGEMQKAFISFNNFSVLQLARLQLASAII